MQRITPVDAGTVPEPAKTLRAAVTKRLGDVPNIVSTMARSSATLEGYLGLSGGLAKGRFSAALREQIALTVAGADAYDYRAAGHDDEDPAELTGHVAVNLFTNYFNHIAGIEIDFPHVFAAAA